MNTRRRDVGLALIVVAMLAASLAGCTAPVDAGAQPPAPTNSTVTSAEALPTADQLGPPVARETLVGRWSVTGPGVLPETYATFGIGMVLQQPCGPLKGVWAAADTGALAVELDNAGPTCLTTGGRNWTRTSVAQQAWGNKVVLTQESGEPDVVLTPAPASTTSAGQATPAEVRARQFPPSAPLPSGYLPVDQVTGRWVRDVPKASFLRDIDGVDITGGLERLADITGFGQRGDSDCQSSSNVTVLVNRDGSWTPFARVRISPAVCNFYGGPKLPGPDPLVTLAKAAGGGIDKATGEFVLFDAKGRTLQRLVPLEPFTVLTESATP